MEETLKKHTNFQDGYIVRNKVKKTRYYADNEFLEKGYAALLGRKAEVYYCLLKHANSETQICWPDYETIMEETGIKSRNDIVATLNVLEYLKMIVIKEPTVRRSNTYYVLAHTQWRELNSIARNTVKAVLKMTRKEYLNWRKGSITGNTLNQRSKSTNEIKDINNNQKRNDGFQSVKDIIKKYGGNK